MEVFDASRTRAALDPAALVAAVERALTEIARGTVSVPPRVAAMAPAGLLGAMPGYVPGLGMAAKLVSVFGDPRRPGRSHHRGVVVLFDEHDGRPLAVMDAEPITALRTAAVATVSMRALAPPDQRRVAVIGSGTQAAAQVELLAALHPDLPVTVGARDLGRARQVAAGHPQAAPATIEEAVRGAGTVFCCTGATTPVIEHAWLAGAVHVSSVGGSHGPELPPETIAAGALHVEWEGAVTAPPPAGAHELQGLPLGRATLLGAASPGRRPGPLTVFKSTGHAALDVAAAAVVYRASGL